MLTIFSPLESAARCASTGDLVDLQSHLAHYASTVTVFKSLPAAGDHAEAPSSAQQPLDSVAASIIQSVLSVLKAAALFGQCNSLEVIKQSLTTAAWSGVQLNSEQLFQAACEGRQATAYLWLASQGMQETRQDLLRAARAGLLCVLQARHRSGYSWDSDFVCAAAQSDDTGCLAFLHQTCGLPLPSGTCLISSRAGSVACLRYANSMGCELSDSLISAALQNHGSKQTQNRCGACIRWLLAHRCPVPRRLDPTELYIVNVKQHMLKERRTWALVVLRRPPVSGLSSLPLSCCESILESADLWIPLKQTPGNSQPAKQPAS